MPKTLTPTSNITKTIKITSATVEVTSSAFFAHFGIAIPLFTFIVTIIAYLIYDYKRKTIKFLIRAV